MKLMEILMYICVLLIACHQSVFAWRSFRIIFTSITYDYEPTLLNVKAEIINTTEDTAINFEANVLQDVKDVQLTFAIAFDGDEENIVTLVNKTVSLCKFLKERSQEPLLHIIYDEILKHGNFFNKCPIKKGLYKIHNYRLDEEMLPSYVPETKFMVYFTITYEKRTAFNCTITGEVDKSKGFNNLKMFSLG